MQPLPSTTKKGLRPFVKSERLTLWESKRLMQRRGDAESRLVDAPIQPVIPFTKRGPEGTPAHYREESPLSEWYIEGIPTGCPQGAE